jgi:hypothetical protein
VRILVTVALLLTAACGTSAPPGPPEVGTGAGTWRELPAAPLAPRQGPVAVWTGAEALFLGGDPSAPCPPGADCAGPDAYLRDGAAFDPERSTWRRTAPALAPIGPWTAAAVIGDEVYLEAARGLQAYDASEDTWTLHRSTIPLPAYAGLVADRGRVIVVRSERHREDAADVVLDPETGTWSDLPPDSLGPAFDRVITSTPLGLVLTGQELVPQPGSEEPSLVKAALLRRGAEQWELLPESDQLGGWRWTWTGARLVDPTLGGADGGEVNGYGRTIPYGGVLDPATGAWARLPDPPEPLTGGWPVEALGGPLSAIEGWVYDDRDRSWTRIPRPEGAPSDPGSAVWAGERLIVLGGVDPDAGYTVEAMSEGAWIYERRS